MTMFRAKRLDYSDYEVLIENGQRLAFFRYPKLLWPTKGTLSESSGDPFKINPVMEMNGINYCFRRELLNPKGYSPHYLILGDSSQEERLIEADCPPGRLVQIQYQNASYQLKLESRLSYKYTLQEGSRTLARFSDTTGFFNFSIRATYDLETFESLPPLLSCFSYFLSVCRGG